MKSTLLRSVLPLIIGIIIPKPQSCQACQVCLKRSICYLGALRGSQSLATIGNPVLFVTQVIDKRSIAFLGPAATKDLFDREGIKNAIFHLSRADTKETETEAETQAESGYEEKPAQPTTMSGLMIASIGFYKEFISPLLPPACRFVPTCSQYGVQAIKEFGPTKGMILIAWRLLRCSPVGGKGYDPPKWPPVSYTFSSY